MSVILQETKEPRENKRNYERSETKGILVLLHSIIHTPGHLLVIL